MDTISIIVIVVVLLVAVLALGGYLASRRRFAAEATAMHAQAREADQSLAAAHAQDKGWERGALEDAARRAFTDLRGREPVELMLVQVIDRPGVEEDEAVFHADGERLVLGRTGGAWAHRGSA